MPPLLLYEDDDLLVVHKPAGVNTHKPDPFAPDGIHEWLQQRQRLRLSILHRLDKDTSGVLVFGKSSRANHALAQQFQQHTVDKRYLLLVAHRPTRSKFRVRTAQAITEFALLAPCGQWYLLEARPITGKTHQIRQHAAHAGCPIVGDTLYGGVAAPRLMLHAHRIQFYHPRTEQPVTFTASVPQAFETPEPLTVAREYRQLLFGDDTNAYRLISGAADGFPGVIVDSYAGQLLVQWQTKHTQPALLEQLGPVAQQFATRQLRTAPVGGPTAPFPVRENGLTFLVTFSAGLGTGLFPDQRENRWRLLGMNLRGQSVLNCFAYTCAFSVAAASAGALTTSVDLSRRYLERGQENFRANQLDPSQHEFLVGDVFVWLRKFAQHSRRWTGVILDPPTFSTTKQGRVFRAARDYEQLAALALPLVAPGGWLLCATNQRTLAPATFQAILEHAARHAGRQIASLDYVTQPLDYRLGPGEQPYLKTFWMFLR